MDDLSLLTDEELQNERDTLLRDLTENRNRLCARARNGSFLGLRDHRERMPIARPQKHLVTAAIRKRKLSTPNSDAATEPPETNLVHPVTGGEHVAHVVFDKAVEQMTMSDGSDALRAVFVAMTAREVTVFWMDRLGSDVFLRYSGKASAYSNDEKFLDVALTAKGDCMAILSESSSSTEQDDKGCDVTLKLSVYNVELEPRQTIVMEWPTNYPARALAWVEDEDSICRSVAVAGDDGYLEVFCLSPTQVTLKYRKVVGTSRSIGRLVQFKWIPILSKAGTDGRNLAAVYASDKSNSIVVWDTVTWVALTQVYSDELSRQINVCGVLHSPSESSGVWGLVAENSSFKLRGVLFGTDDFAAKTIETIALEGKATVVLLHSRPCSKGANVLVIGVDGENETCRLVFVDLNQLQVAADLVIPGGLPDASTENCARACIGQKTTALTVDGQTVHFVTNPCLEEVS